MLGNTGHFDTEFDLSRSGMYSSKSPSAYSLVELNLPESGEHARVWIKVSSQVDRKPTGFTARVCTCGLSIVRSPRWWAFTFRLSQSPRGRKFSLFPVWVLTAAVIPSSLLRFT